MQKTIPQKLFDKKFLRKYIEKKLTLIDRDALELLGLEISYIKKTVRDDFFHFVICLSVKIKNKTGQRKLYKIYCASFAKNGRMKMYKILQMTYKNGFDSGEVITQHPLWYDKTIMSAFYIGVPGDNVLTHAKNDYLSYKTIARIARGIKKFHTLKASKKLGLNKHSFSRKFLDPSNILERKYNKNTKRYNEVTEALEKIKSQKKHLNKIESHISHGDFHPENIIINRFDSEQIALIDFSESCLAPVHYDIASFLEQLNFMTLNYLSRDEFIEFENIFLEEYFEKPKKKIEKIDMKYINLYRAWTALKNAVYFMIFEDEISAKQYKYLMKRVAYLLRKI